MKNTKITGLIFVGCMMAGMGFGILFGNLVAGMFIGMGIGFAGQAIMMIVEKERRQESIFEDGEDE